MADAVVCATPGAVGEVLRAEVHLAVVSEVGDPRGARRRADWERVGLAGRKERGVVLSVRALAGRGQDLLGQRVGRDGHVARDPGSGLRPERHHGDRSTGRQLDPEGPAAVGGVHADTRCCADSTGARPRAVAHVRRGCVAIVALGVVHTTARCGIGLGNARIGLGCRVALGRCGIGLGCRVGLRRHSGVGLRRRHADAGTHTIAEVGERIRALVGRIRAGRNRVAGAEPAWHVACHAETEAVGVAAHAVHTVAGRAGRKCRTARLAVALGGHGDAVTRSVADQVGAARRCLERILAGASPTAGAVAAVGGAGTVTLEVRIRSAGDAGTGAGGTTGHDRDAGHAHAVAGRVTAHTVDAVLGSALAGEPADSTVGLEDHGGLADAGAVAGIGRLTGEVVLAGRYVATDAEVTRHVAGHAHAVAGRVAAHAVHTVAGRALAAGRQVAEAAEEQTWVDHAVARAVADLPHRRGTRLSLRRELAGASPIAGSTTGGIRTGALAVRVGVLRNRPTGAVGGSGLGVGAGHAEPATDRITAHALHAVAGDALDVAGTGRAVGLALVHAETLAIARRERSGGKGARRGSRRVLAGADGVAQAAAVVGIGADATVARALGVGSLRSEHAVADVAGTLAGEAGAVAAVVAAHALHAEAGLAVPLRPRAVPEAGCPVDQGLGVGAARAGAAAGLASRCALVLGVGVRQIRRASAHGTDLVAGLAHATTSRVAADAVLAIAVEALRIRGASRAVGEQGVGHADAGAVARAGPAVGQVAHGTRRRVHAGVPAVAGTAAEAAVGDAVAIRVVLGRKRLAVTLGVIAGEAGLGAVAVATGAIDALAAGALAGRRLVARMAVRVVRRLDAGTKAVALDRERVDRAGARRSRLRVLADPRAVAAAAAIGAVARARLVGRAGRLGLAGAGHEVAGLAHVAAVRAAADAVPAEAGDALRVVAATGAVRLVVQPVIGAAREGAHAAEAAENPQGTETQHGQSLHGYLPYLVECPLSHSRKRNVDRTSTSIFPPTQKFPFGRDFSYFLNLLFYSNLDCKGHPPTSLYFSLST